MENKFVGTNVFLRYLTKDDLSKYERCREMFERALEGKIAFNLGDGHR
jgi:predicted nucleic acid-binding protein